MFNQAGGTFFGKLFGQEENQYGAQRADLGNMMRAKPDQFAPSGSKGWQNVEFVVPNSGQKPVGAGVFRFDSVAELRDAAKAELQSLKFGAVSWAKNHTSGDSRALHSEQVNGLFQAASQFNCLEFVGPSVTPERGITCYMNDRTQGPACALACAGATAFRNYLVPVVEGALNCGNRVLPEPTFNDQVTSDKFGQTAELQLNGIAEVEQLIKKQQKGEAANQDLWRVKNGYIELTNTGNSFLPTLWQSIKTEQPQLEEQLIRAVRVGCQFDSEVTDFRITNPAAAAANNPEPLPTVAQVFASACSIGYSRYPDAPWEPIAKISLKGAYEATFYAYIIHFCRCQKQNKRPNALFLTKLGGGVFANPTEWIAEAMIHAEQQTNLLFKEVAASSAGGGETREFPFQVLLTHFRDVEGGYEGYINGGKSL